MSDYERQKWERRWADLDPDIVREPTSTLTILALVTNGGEAMDLACGDGRNAIYLAQRGFRVHALDISSKALDMVNERARDLDLAVVTELADIDEHTFLEDSYDLVNISFYVNRSPELNLSIKQALRPGGFIVQEQHCDSEFDVAGPAEERFRLRPGELLNLFRDFHVRFYSETLEDLPDSRISVARIIAQKPYANI